MRFKSLKLIGLALLFIVGFSNCDKENNEPVKNIAKLGAQSNISFGGFLSIDEKKVYTQDLASQNQEMIDILCFYEEAGGNNIALAAPGTGISGIFTGETAPTDWTTKNQTYFTLPATELTVEQFDQLKDGDAVIEGYFNATITSGNRKAKNMAVNDIWAFKTVANKFGVLKVVSVEQGAAGYVEFEYKVK
jgi:hypothetical protein